MKILFNNKSVKCINSRLVPKPERPDPIKLASNTDISFQGSIVLGMGFTLTHEERDALIARNPKNAKRIFPYLGGNEVNSSPTHDFHRYVINFGQMSLEEAEQWPDLISIVREKVKPGRDKNNREQYRKYWWWFGERRPALYAAIQNLPRCLVTACVTKHLTFTFQPTDRVFSNTLFIFALHQHSHFATLQSRIHEFWVRLLSSTLGEGLRYSATDCFENFPFPDDKHFSAQSLLEAIGKKLYETRAKFMVDTQQGLTQTYNLLKDPSCDDLRINELRQLHQQMDYEVLKAYGWDDIHVPKFSNPINRVEEIELENYKDEILDRLFEYSLKTQSAV